MSNKIRNQRNPLYVELGKNISSFRKDLSINQTILSSQIGMSQQYLASIEAGIRRIQIEELLKLCEVLHVSVNEILPLPKPTKKTGPRPKLAVACEKLTQLPEKEQNAVMVMIDSLAAANSLSS